MKIIRVEKNTNYTIISNYHLQDKNLSLKAKGLMTFLLHLTEEWDISVTGLTKVLKENTDAINSALKELEENGYLVRQQERNDGKFCKMKYILYEKTTNGITTNGLSQLENPEQINTKEINTKEINTKEINKKNIIKENFETFWQVYPKKRDKAKTEKWFEKNNPDEELMKTILKSLEILKRTKEWQKDNGQYIPLPTTWLNGKRWQDEIINDEVEMTEAEENAIIEKELREEGFYDNR